MDKKKVVTKEGLKKLKEELKRRQEEERKKIADKLDEAKAIGDLSENAAYTSALEEYQHNEVRINELKETLKNVQIAPDKSGDQFVNVGDTIIVKIKGSDSETKLSIVGEGEGDPGNNSVSADSVVGKALLGKKKGDTVEINLPKRKTTYTIVDVK